MPIASPLTAPQSWDVVKLGTTVSPGYCVWKGWKRTNKWDVKAGKGTQGATITYTGREPAKGSFTFYLWTDAQFTAWASFVALFAYDPSKQNVQAVQIAHPALSLIGITQVVSEDIGAPIHEGQGLYSIEVSLLEYIPPPPTNSVAQVVGTNAGQDQFQNPPAANADESQIASLLAKAAQQP